MAERQPDLGPLLRREAERHTPDRAAMLARIVRSRAEPRRRWAMPALRPVAAAASVVATLVVGVAGIRLAGDRTGGTTAATGTSVPAVTGSGSPASSAPMATSPGPSVSPPRPSGSSARPSVSSPQSPTSAGPGESRDAGTPDFRPVDGFLRSAAVVDSHSNDTWTQGNLTLTTTEEITELDLVISVARTAGVKDAGKWSTVPVEMITPTVAVEKDALVYRFKLHPGRTLAPGEYVFAAQFLHAGGGRDARADTYGAVVAAGGEHAEVTGAFRNS